MSRRVARFVTLLALACGCRISGCGTRGSIAALPPDAPVSATAPTVVFPALAPPSPSEADIWSLVHACRQRGFPPFEDPVAVVTACERAVRFATDAERPERLLGLGRLYSGLETALCGACGYRPGRGDACEAMIDFARLESDSFARRKGRPGFAYTGREFRTVLERWPADSSAEAARVALDALPKLEAGLPEAECRALERQALLDACPPTFRFIRAEFGVLWRCEAGAALAEEADLPRLLLTQGRLHVQLVHDRLSSYVKCEPGCPPLEAYASAHPGQYEVVTEAGESRRQYTGWHFRELRRRFRNHPLAADASCDLVRLKSGPKGWGTPECRAVIERAEPGPCPASFPTGVDPLTLAAGCESTALRASEADRPALLLAAGRLYRDLGEACREGRCAGLARLQWLRDDLFLYDEICGGHHYEGKHFDEVVRRWPERPEADDAAWDLARLPRGGECEGFIDCWLSIEVGHLGKYAAQFPRGRHIGEAVSGARGALAENLLLLQKGGGEWDDAMGRKELSSVEAAATKLSDDHRAALFEAVAPWWDQIRDPARAQSARARAREAKGRDGGKPR